MNIHNLSSRQLALRLSALDEDSRESLLAEIPSTKRTELRGLIQQLWSIQKQPSVFEAVMADIESEKYSFNERQLQQLLKGEPDNIIRQLIGIFVRNETSRLTPHVHQTIAKYLVKRSATAFSAPATTRPRWKFWS